MAWLPGADRDEHGRALAGLLRESGWVVRTGAAPDDVRLLVLRLAPPADLAEAVTALRDAVLTVGAHLAALERAARTGRAGVVVLTALDGAAGYTTASLHEAATAGVSGLVKTVPAEAPGLFSRAIDLAPELDPARAARLVLREIMDDDERPHEVAVDLDGRRRIVVAADQPEPRSTDGRPFGPDDVVVLTGGARGITSACAVALAERGCQLVLVGRTPLADDPEWAIGAPTSELRRLIADRARAAGERPSPREVAEFERTLLARREIRATLAAVEAAGGSATYRAADLTDRAATATALADLAGSVTALVHGAGVLADQALPGKTAPAVSVVLTTKITAAGNVLDALADAPLRRVVFFSSVAGFYGNRGQADYATANEALNRLATAVAQQRPGVDVQSLVWGAWDGGMVSPPVRAEFARRGIRLIPVAEGVRAFLDTTAYPSGVAVIGPDQGLWPTPTPRRRSGRLRVRRDLTRLAGDPALGDHAIGGVPVLPATAAIGAVLRVAERVLPGPVRVVRGFAVLKGVLFDDTAPPALNFDVTAEDGSATVTVVDESGRPRYRAVVEARRSTVGYRRTDLPPNEGGTAFDHIYRDGTMFSGPRLQGIRRLLAEDDEGLVLAAVRPTDDIGTGEYGTERYHPLLADLLLQAAGSWLRRNNGLASLPAAVARVEVFRDVPPGEPLTLVVRPAVLTSAGATCTVSAYTRDGDPVLVFDGVELVGSQSLEARFRGAREPRS